MSKVPSELLYVATHEWVRQDSDDLYTIGVTDHAQQLLGDMVFVDLPGVGRQLVLSDDCAVAESVKAASDIFSPLSGEVVAINSSLNENPELLNSDPYGSGWLIQIRISDKSELDKLLSAEAYTKAVAN